MANSTAYDIRILVIDDFEVVKLMMRSALKKLGITSVSEAGDGKEALNMIHQAYGQNQPFQLVLCDWNMPEMSGLQFIREIRKFPQFASLNVVLVTATSDHSEISAAYKLGVTEYIVKPIAPDELQSKLSSIIFRMRKAA